MALTYLRNTNRKTVKTLDEKLCETVASSNLSVELMKPRNILDKIDNGEVDVMDIGITLLDDDATTEPIGWFTSLWTLQEAVLCPDLHLFSRAWERLNDRNGSAISLSALFLFLRCTEPHCKADGPQEPTFTDPLEYECVLSRVERMDIPRVFPEWPRGPQLMKRFLNATQFDTVIETPALSQISVIVNANSRVSSGNRAPAIMSAIGITDWYLARIAQPSSERKPETLVFGSFPLAFVREAAVKLGGPFYEAIPCQAQTRLKKRHVLFSHKAVGSMLPFSRVQGTMGSNIPTVSSLSCLYPISHPTVKSWVIRKNGSVRMKAVGIIMASKWPAVESNNQSKVPAIFSWAKEDGSGGLTATTVDFQYILSQFAGNDKIYAVSLWHDQGFQHGVLLQSPRFRGIGRRQLVRIGSFDITNVPIPEPTGVNWLVI
jgi:hypothetical protein